MRSHYRSAPRLSVFLLLLLASGVAATPPPPAAGGELAARRERVLAEITRTGAQGAVVLLRAASPDRFAGDVDYPYRPDNNLYYLTGIDEPGCALLLCGEPRGDRGREILFLAPPDPLAGIWVSARMTATEASARSGIPPQGVLTTRDLRQEIAALRLGSPARPHPRPLFFDAGGGFRAGQALPEPYGFLLETLGSDAFHLDLRSPAPVIERLRQVKSPAEVALLEKAIAVTDLALIAAWRAIKPGAFEYEVRAAIESVYLREGCSGWSFPPIIGSGPNSCVLHYDRHGRQMLDGDLVVLDIGAEYGFYAGDVSRTVPVNGRFSPRQRRVYDAVLNAQEAAIKVIRPGIPYADVHAAAFREIVKALRDLALITRDDQAHRYFPHGTSHGLGLDVHDPMPAGMLAAGMVITVEPGIYIAEEALGVRIEDDVLVTGDGCRVLSTGVPKKAEDVEAMMSARAF